MYQKSRPPRKDARDYNTFSPCPFPYEPEGFSPVLQGAEHRFSLPMLERAFLEDRIIEAPVTLCDNQFRLYLDLAPDVEGIMEREEVVLTRNGEPIKDIAVLTRVGKTAACKILSIREEEGRTIVALSRREAQRDCYAHYLFSLSPGDLVHAKVTHLEPFGAFCDVGCGIVALLSVDAISVSRISHPRDRLAPGDRITAVIKSIDPENGRIFLSLKELLGTWEENAALFSPGETVTGIVRSIESYGVFVELMPNLAGLAERSVEGVTAPLPAIGQSVAVYIKSILPERMKIKLVLIDPSGVDGGTTAKRPLRYFIDTAETRHLSRFLYSPPTSQRRIETIFDEETP